MGAWFERLRRAGWPAFAILLVMLLTVAFIFSFSLEDPAASAARSEKVLRLILRVFRMKELPFNVRKLAHLTEYAVLGLETMAFALVMSPSREMTSFFRTVSFGLWVAVADESLQLLPGRGSSLRDVQIDMLGFTIGAVIALFALGIKLVLFGRRKRSR